LKKKKLLKQKTPEEEDRRKKGSRHTLRDSHRSYKRKERGSGEKTRKKKGEAGGGFDPNETADGTTKGGDTRKKQRSNSFKHRGKEC